MKKQLPESVEITAGLDDPEDESWLRSRVAQKLGVDVTLLPRLTLLKRSLDARQHRIQFHLLVSLEAESRQSVRTELPALSAAVPIVIVGDGPAGLFCAYELARRGLKSIVVERGKQVQPRRRDLKLLNARGRVDPESNYCFGEGGAGTYSDGKLYTRSHKRGNVRDVLLALFEHGAPEAVLSESRPHIGSNLLPKIISSLRESLEAAGVEFAFGRKLSRILVEGQGADRRVCGVELTRLGEGESGTVELRADAVVLATGHSARDVFQEVSRLEVRLEAKAFALGVRIEHPQLLINQIQFGRHAGHPKLGAASYSLVEQEDGRGVFSFCMCPGGWIVPAMTDADHLVVNGMSLSKRDSGFANSGMVVGVEVADYLALGLHDPLAGVEVQRRAERVACEMGGGGNRAPATRVTDFLRGRPSSTLPETSYLPGLTAANVAACLDASGLDLTGRLRASLKRFDKKMKGYLTEEAVLVGVESRTSAPVRVVRETESLTSPDLAGLYPAGEGAGYAGGIVSAAVDGMRIAERIALGWGR